MVLAHPTRDRRHGARSAPAVRNAVVHERIDFIRFVKDGVYPELRATHAYIGGGVVAEDDHFLPGAALAACFQHPEATALAQEKINDGQVPLTGALLEPDLAFVFCFSEPHRLYRRQLFQSPDQVFSDGCVVFNNVSAEFHSLIQESGQNPYAMAEDVL